MNSQCNEYLAWVPCLSGKIFFHDLSPGLGSFDLYHLRNDADEIILSSVVDWRDNYKRGKGAKQRLFRVVLVGKLEDDGFSGQSYLIDRTIKDDTGKNENTEFELDLIAIFNSLYGGGKYASTTIHLEKKTCPLTIHKVGFQLEKDGICRLQYNGSKIGDGDAFLSVEGQGELSVRQVFFYLRDSIHKHVHHQNQNDCITEIHLDEKDDKTNAHNLIDDLILALSDIRFTELDSKHSYGGIVMYGKSLLLNLRRRGWIDDLECKQLTNTIENILGSMEYAGLNRVGDMLSVPREFWGFLKNTSVYFLAIIGPILVFLNTASRVGQDYALKNFLEMYNTCSGFLLYTFICERIYGWADLYMKGTLAPIMVMIIVLFFFAVLISLIRVTGKMHSRGQSFTNMLRMRVRGDAHSHSKNLSFAKGKYWLVQAIGFFQLFFRWDSYEKPKVNRFKRAIAMLFLIAPFPLLGCALYVWFG